MDVSQVVKQRMQTGQFTSAPDAVRLIVSKEGFKGLYAVFSGFCPSMWICINLVSHV